MSIEYQVVPDIDTEEKAKRLENEGCEESEVFSLTNSMAENLVQLHEDISGDWNALEDQVRSLEQELMVQLNKLDPFSELPRQVNYLLRMLDEMDKKKLERYVSGSEDDLMVTSLLWQKVADLERDLKAIDAEFVNQIAYQKTSLKEQKKAFDKVTELLEISVMDNKKSIEPEEETPDLVKCYIDQLQLNYRKVAALEEQLQDQKKKESTMKKTAEELRLKVVKEQEEKRIVVFAAKSLEKKVISLQQTIKDAILGLEEEKKAAIRSLCSSIKYYRGRYECLKKVLSKMREEGEGSDVKETA